MQRASVQPQGDEQEEGLPGRRGVDPKQEDHAGPSGIRAHLPPREAKVSAQRKLTLMCNLEAVSSVAGGGSTARMNTGGPRVGQRCAPHVYVGWGLKVHPRGTRAFGYWRHVDPFRPKARLRVESVRHPSPAPGP